MQSTETQLISAFAASWNKVASPALGLPSTLEPLALREVSGDAVAAALAVAVTWPCAVAAPCSGALGGVLVCLLKEEEGAEFDRLLKLTPDGSPRHGVRTLFEAVLYETASSLADSAPVSFGAPAYMDLAADAALLPAVVGDFALLSNFTLCVGDVLNTQGLLLYAPSGSLAPVHVTGAPAQAGAAARPRAQTAPPPAPAQPREEARPRNKERLLEVELEVVVRFGVTSVPLREVVRMGTGAMIELNRAIDEPVELLVNGRPFARGEVVVVDGYYGVRITEIGTPAERAHSLI
jgi:flagellar motor switch protein FliN